jgi:hypothetical protein
MDTFLLGLQSANSSFTDQIIHLGFLLNKVTKSLQFSSENHAV